MTDPTFDRIADAFLATGPVVLPDRVLDAAFEEVRHTRQRRVLWHGLRRFAPMNSYAKIAVAAVAVVAVGLVGLSFLDVGGGGVGGPPAASPSPSPTPAPTATPTPSPTAAPEPTAPSLTGQFTSDLHGYSIAVPEGWETRSATMPWTSQYVDGFSDSADLLMGPEGHGFVALASQPLGDRTPAEWEADAWQIVIADEPTSEGCPAEARPVTVDGATGVEACDLILVTSGGRGYWIRDFLGDDAPWDRVYGATFVESLLASITFQPEDAVDGVPSPSPS
jgi:hypothetical protein